MPRFDADLGELRRVSNAGQLQKLRRVENAAANDHLAIGPYGPRRSLPAAFHVIHADDALASMTRDVACACVMIERFGRPRAGVRKARAALTRRLL